MTIAIGVTHVGIRKMVVGIISGTQKKYAKRRKHSKWDKELY